MLLVDADHVTAQDLYSFDPEAEEIASANGVALTGDYSIARENWGECSQELMRHLQSFGNNYESVPHPRVHPSQISITSFFTSGQRSPLQRWMVACALVHFYEAMLRRTVNNDRFANKLASAVAERSRRWLELQTCGLPIVRRPLPRPGAQHESMGRWDASNVTLQSGSLTGSTTVSISWVDDEGVESAISNPVPVVLSNHSIVINIDSLHPSVSETWNPRRTPAAWNVYAGNKLQTITPLPLSTTTHTLTTIASNGRQAGSGQSPDYAVRLRLFLGRA